jgi:hypothetical protein
MWGNNNNDDDDDDDNDDDDDDDDEYINKYRQDSITFHAMLEAPSLCTELMPSKYICHFAQISWFRAGLGFFGPLELD